MGTRKTTAEHAAEVKSLGILILKGEYKGARTKTTYYCPKHDFTDEALPTNVLKGRGLLCCKQQGSQDSADRKKAKAAAKYDSELADYGILKRLAEYVDSKTPILHLCLKHGERHQCRPSDGRRGKGLACCLRESQGNDNLRFTHDQFLVALKERNPNIEWVSGDYTNQQSKVTCHCIKHDYTQKNVWAMQILAGHGLKCCGIENSREVGRNTLNGASIDNVWRALTNQLERKGLAYIYLNESPVLPHNKFGISNEPKKRAKTGGYGKQLIDPRFFPDRRDAVLIEQAYKYGYSSEIPEELAEWTGREELTTYKPEEFIEIIEYLENSLIEMGRWKFAEEFCDPREVERARKESS